VFGGINSGFMPYKYSHIFIIRKSFLILIGVERKGETETKDSMLTLLLKVENKYVVSFIDDYAGERNSVALYSFGFEFFVLVLVQV